MKQYCAPTEHDYQTHVETTILWCGYGYSGKTLIYCRKCGHHFYIKKSPQDYTPSTTTWTYTVPTSQSYFLYSGTTTPT